MTIKEAAALAVGRITGLLAQLSVEGCAILMADPEFRSSRDVQAICDARARIFCPHDGLDQTTRRAVQGICSSLDVRVAGEMADGKLAKGSVLAVLHLFRETVRAVDPSLSEDLKFANTEAAPIEPPRRQVAKEGRAS